MELRLYDFIKKASVVLIQGLDFGINLMLRLLRRKASELLLVFNGPTRLQQVVLRGSSAPS